MSEIRHFVHNGITPKSFKSNNWIKNHFLVREGYSLAEIDEMDNEQYDYLIGLVMEMKQKGNDHPLNGGI